MRTVCTKIRNGDFKRLSESCSQKGISVSEQLRRLIFNNFEVSQSIKKSNIKNSEKIPIVITLTKNLIKVKEFELAKLNQQTKKLSENKTKGSLFQEHMKKIAEKNQDIDALKVIVEQLAAI